MSLPALKGRLRACEHIGELFAQGTDLACEVCGFTRGLILSIEDRELRPTHSDALTNPASDLLRRAALDTPVRLTPRTEEADLLRGARSRERGSGARRPSVLAEQLGLAQYAFAAIAPNGLPLALVVLDRLASPVTPEERSLVAACAAVIESSLELLVVRARLSDLSAELRHLTVSAQALIQEAVRSPISLPTARGSLPGFALLSAETLTRHEGAGNPLTEREMTIMAHLAAGRSNRHIAERLVVSPETVKAHVTKILRKLEATNRVEAVTRYLALTRPSDASDPRMSAINHPLRD